MPEAFDGYTIVQISDLHGKSFGREQQRLVGAVREAQPDIIVMTGDIIDQYHGTGEWGCATGCAFGGDCDSALRLVEQVVSIAPVYYVNGNHDEWCFAYDEYIEQVKKLGVNFLSNEMTYITTETGESICIAGLANRFEGSDILGRVAREESYTILLAHKPHYFDLYCESGAELVFSGHAHGGQFGSGSCNNDQGWFAPGQGALPSLTSGTFTDGGTTMVVSRGLGSSIFPQRLGNRPELVVVTLHCSDGDK